MKKSLLWICLITFILLASAQELLAKDWEYQKSDTTSNLTAVSFVDHEYGWAVGENATILATSDGGVNWKVMSASILDQVFSVFPYPRTCHFRSVCFLDRENGWVAGEMTLPGVEPEDIYPVPVRFGVILRTRDGGQTWECQYPYNMGTGVEPEAWPRIKQINDVFFLNRQEGWAVGDGFYYLTTRDGGNTWDEKPIGFWVIPEIRQNLTATKWISSKWGWVAGYQYDMNFPETRNGFIAHTEDGGETWEIDDFLPVSSATFPALTDLEIKVPPANTVCPMPSAWAVGEQGVILHYQNHAPEICWACAEPQTVYAGQAVDLYVSVKDLDGPSDIEKVTVDARSIGGGMVVLERTWLDPDDRRCVLFQGEAEISPLATYGSHRLPAEAVDYDGACASDEIDLFVITSWVKIKRTMAIPDPVAVGDKVLLAAEVGIIAPKCPDSDEIVCPYNKVEKVTVDITELLGVDCLPGTDCIIIVEMTDPDGDGIYTYIVESVTGGPGKYELPVWAIDTLGHEDKAKLTVRVVESAKCYFDLNHDGDVDGTDLADFAGYFRIVDSDHSFLEAFASEFGRIDCTCPVFPRIEEYSNSGCLPGSEINSSEEQYPWCGEDQIEVIAEGNTIHLIHKNATYNCCPDDIEVSLSVEGNLLRLTEKEILTHPCTCLCCYDVKSTIVDLPSGSYTLEYCWHDYETRMTKCYTDEVVIPARHPGCEVH